MNLVIIPRTIWDILSSSFMKRVYQVLFGFAVVVAVFGHTNLAPVIAGIGALIWFQIACSLSDDNVFFSFSHKHRYPGAGRDPRGRYFTNTYEWALVVGIPLLLVGMSTFLFVPFFYDYQVISHNGGDTQYRQGMYITTMNPFTDSVRNYSEKQTINVDPRGGGNFHCIAKSSDGRSVRSAIGAALKLPFSGVQAAHDAAGSEHKLGALVKGALCRRFEEVIATYRLESIPTLLTVESKTVDDRRGMNRLGVQYAGEIAVLRIYAYDMQ